MPAYTVRMNEPKTDFDMDAEAFRRLGHRLVDAMADHLSAESEDPILPAVTG